MAWNYGSNGSKWQLYRLALGAFTGEVDELRELRDFIGRGFRLDQGSGGSD